MQARIVCGEREFRFPFVVFLPKHSTKAVPAVVLINNRNFISLDQASAENDPFWPVEALIENGYATAAFYTSDVDPDDKNRYAEGLRAFMSADQLATDESWGSLSAWGWAASQIRIYLASNPVINGSQISLVGHSRGGKTALWAAAEDQEFAIAYSNESGCGGAALSRRQYGETVERITSSFPHWFCKNFSNYAGRESEMPVDQHELLALIAPRGLYVASADEDLWADPRGEYLSLVSAAPVYEILNEKTISEPMMPSMGTQRVVGKTGYHVRAGDHGLIAVDWDHFFKFAESVLTK